MNGCAACFENGGPIDVEASPGVTGKCDFCGTCDTQVWDVSQWGDLFAGLLEMYELHDDGRNLAERVQRDWHLFSFSDETLIRSFFGAVFPGGHPLLEKGARLRPRYRTDGDGADHASAWEEFCEDLRHSNRFFPRREFDHEFLQRMVEENAKHLEHEVLYRGRACDTAVPLLPAEMGRPTPEKALAGRGNPVGIPHLYVATDIDTCIKESRAVQYGFVSVASFRVPDPIHCLDLSGVSHRNPFLELTDRDLVEVLVSQQMLEELGRELSKPMRPGESALEYVPTQYLCEFVKSVEISGIQYRSSLNPAGQNLVLFDDGIVEIREEVKVFEITGVEVIFEEHVKGH